jgi:hypothetical protein
VQYAPETAREKIEGSYVKLRLEWEKARREAPQEEGEEEQQQVAALSGPALRATAQSVSRWGTFRDA